MIENFTNRQIQSEHEGLGYSQQVKIYLIVADETRIFYGAFCKGTENDILTMAKIQILSRFINIYRK